MKLLPPTALRIGAIALVLCIGADLVNGPNCDPVFAAPGQASIQEKAGTVDGCGVVCVADCFCCSRAINDPFVISVSPGGFLAAREEPIASFQLDGILTPVFHPPLLRA